MRSQREAPLQTVMNVIWAPSGPGALVGHVTDDEGVSEGKGTGSSWCAYAGSVCVSLLVVVDTVCDRTSSEYAEVKAMCPNETVVKYYKYIGVMSRAELSSH